MACAITLSTWGTLPAYGLGGGGTPPAPTTQMRSWLFTSNLVNFNSGTATASTQIAGTSGGGAFQLSAAAFNASNQLLFFVGSNNFTGPNSSPNYPNNAVYTPNNQVIGTLAPIINPNKSFDETDWVVRGKEMVVVPVPGVCSKYYLFYTLVGNYSGVLAYAIIDCSSGTPVIAQNSQLVDNTQYNGTTPGLAASQPAADGSRTLYVAGGTAVKSYRLQYGGGLGSANALSSGTFAGGSCEAELSPDGSKLAWAPQNSYQVNLFEVSTGVFLPAFTPVYSRGTATTGSIYGLEFSGDSKKLFVTGLSGAAAYTLATQAQTPINATGGSTQLELAFDGLLYFVSGSSGNLYTINPATLAVAASPVTIPVSPISGPLGNSGYFLPDQIDGENYTTYFGNNTPTLSGQILVDGRLLQRTSVTPVYSCNPLKMQVGSSSPDVSRYDIVINSTDASGNITGVYAYTYSTTTLPVALGALNNGYLANPANTGYYQVKIVGYNACQSATTTARMRVSNLVPGSAGFAFNLCNGTGPQAASTSPSTPAILGLSGGGGVDIGFSTGDYDSFQVRFAQYVTGSSPAQFVPIGQLANITSTNGTTYALSLLASQAGLEAGYFLQGHPGANVLHQLTLTVSNACGTSSPLVGYFQTANINCRAVAGIPMPTDKEPFYPNPLGSAQVGHLRFTLPTAQAVSLVLTDALTGKVRQTVLRDALRPAGAQEVEIDATSLPAGVYLYRLTTTDGTTVGRIHKAD